MAVKIDRADMEVQVARVVAEAPASVREALLADREFVEHVNLPVTTTLSSPGGHKITLGEFAKALREVVEGATKVRIKLPSGDQVEVDGALQSDGSVVLGMPNGRVRQDLATLLASDAERCLEAFDSWCADALPPRKWIDHWRKRMQAEGLSDFKFWDLCRYGEATPEALHDKLQTTETLTLAAMVPLNDAHWECLLPGPDGDFKTWRDGALVDWRKDLAGRPSRWRLSRVGFGNAPVARLPDDFMAGVDLDALEALTSQEDPFSLLLALELNALSLDRDDGARQRGQLILQRLFSDTEASKQRFELMGAAIAVSYWGLHHVLSWRSAPLYWQRAAVFAHAGVLTNALFPILADVNGFISWAMKATGLKCCVGLASEGREAPRWGFERIGVRALRSTLFRHSFDAVMAIPEVKRPPEWVAVLDKHATSASGDLGFALLAGPWGDFEGYQPPFQRSEFEVTLNGLGAMTLPVPGLEPFINGVQLESGDLTLLIGYGKGFVAPEGKEETALYILAVLSTAAGIYRNVELADVIADRCVELFPKVDPGTQQRLLSVVLEASNAYREESAGLTWAAKRYERLAWSASKATDLKSIDGIMSILRDLRPAAIPHFAATGAVVRLRTPSLAKPFATSRTSKQ